MGIVINIRGINASGKSTAVREYCKDNSMKPAVIELGGATYKIMTNGRAVALGHYKPFSNSEGCDSYKHSNEQVKRFLCYIMGKLKPEVIIYEKFIWTTSYKFAIEVNSLCRKYGYTFIAVLFDISYECELNRLFKRNGGADVNLDMFDSGRRGAYRSMKRLKEDGVVTAMVNVERVKKENMRKIIPQIIKKYAWR